MAAVSGQFLVVFEGEGEGFPVVGVDVGAIGEFEEDVVVESHHFVVGEDIGKK